MTYNAQELDNKTKTLVKATLARFKKFNFLEQSLLDLVAPHKAFYLRELIIDKTINLLDKKLKLNESTQSYKKLDASQVPPLSVRFKVSLTSPEPEVVASDDFAKLKEEFDTELEKFKTLAKNLFLKTKNLQVDLAKKQLKQAFLEHVHHIIDMKATQDLETMVNTCDIEKIKSHGGHAVLTATAWRSIISKSPELSQTTLELDPININEKERNFVNDLAHYLQITPPQFRHLTLSKFEGYNTTNLPDQFNTTRETTALQTLIANLENFILNLTIPMTQSIFNTYEHKKREIEIEKKLEARVKADKLQHETSAVHDMIDNENNISATQMKDFVKGVTETTIKNTLAKNLNGQFKPGKNKRKGNELNQPNTQRRKPTNTTNNNTNNTDNTNKNSTIYKLQNQPSRQVRFQPPTNNNNNNNNTTGNPTVHNPYKQQPRYNTHHNPYIRNNNSHNTTYHQSYNNNNNNRYRYSRGGGERDQPRRKDHPGDAHNTRRSDSRRY